MVEAVVFIGAAIAGITQLIKLLAPQINGAVTIIVAVVVGIFVAVLDTAIGVTDISIAHGIMIGFASAGVVATAQKIG